MKSIGCNKLASFEFGGENFVQFERNHENMICDFQL